MAFNELGYSLRWSHFARKRKLTPNNNVVTVVDSELQTFFFRVKDAEKLMFARVHYNAGSHVRVFGSADFHDKNEEREEWYDS